MTDDDTAAPARTRPFVRLLAANVVVGVVLLIVAGGRSIAEVWFKIDANSLVGLQAFVEQRVDPDKEDPTLYFDYVLPMLEQPAWLGAIVLLTLFDGLRLLAGGLTVRGARALRRKIGTTKDGD